MPTKKKMVIIPKSEKSIRQDRVKERKANPKANPTNRDIMEAIQDLMDYVMERG
jgi:hypothetical protein